MEKVKEELKNELKKEYKLAWENFSEDDKKQMFAYGERYRKFISDNKTERECVISLVETAKKHGYKDINEVEWRQTLQAPGSKQLREGGDGEVLGEPFRSADPQTSRAHGD